MAADTDTAALPLTEPPQPAVPARYEDAVAELERLAAVEQQVQVLEGGQLAPWVEAAR